MYASGNYPMGAENDPRAPWNQEENEKMEFSCELECTLNKTDTLMSSNYSEYKEMDEDGFYVSDIDTEYIEWEDEWKEQHYTVVELLEIFSKRLQDELKATEEDKSLTEQERRKRVRRLRFLISECDGWEQSELYVSEGD